LRCWDIIRVDVLSAYPVEVEGLKEKRSLEKTTEKQNGEAAGNVMSWTRRRAGIQASSS
jgi:hypothetical protein